MAQHRTCFLAILLFLGGCTMTPPEGGFRRPGETSERIQQINARYGSMSMDADSWGVLDGPTQIAIDFAEASPSELFSLETGFNLGQSEDGGRLSNHDRAEEGLTVLELSGGVLTQFADSDDLFLPYVGTGVSAIWAESDLIASDELIGVRDSSLGFYGKAGLLLRLSEGSYVGLELRQLAATDIDTALGSRELSGTQLSIVFSASF